MMAKYSEYEESFLHSISSEINSFEYFNFIFNKKNVIKIEENIIDNKVRKIPFIENIWDIIT